MAFMVLPEFFYSGHFLSNERKWSGFFVAFSLFLDIDEGECSPSEFPCWMFFIECCCCHLLFLLEGCLWAAILEKCVS